jgi:cytoskeletal protein RodZ
VTIGDALAAARRQAGLTITQVSQRTCIRETIIRGIERNDFSACGGDFYARGHIRSIARAVGAEPEPLIREYDSTQGSPDGITAADVFEPSTPIKLRERRRPNWSAAMALALAAIVGIATYHFLSGPTKASPVASHSTSSSAGSHGSAGAHARAQHPATHKKRSKARTSTASRPKAGPNQVVIALDAVSSDCWVDLTSTSTGQQIFEGTLPVGSSRTWTETQPVSMEIGDPGAVTLTVNGVDQTPPAGSPVTLTLGASQTPQTQG